MLTEPDMALAQPCADDQEPAFSKLMFSQDFNPRKGWHNGRITPYQNLSLSPAAAVFHYGQAIFEGLRAYRTPSGTLNLFRPAMNLKRFNTSASRMAMPTLKEQTHLEHISSLLKAISEPNVFTPGNSVYIRPGMIAVTPKLRQGKAEDYLHFIITMDEASLPDARQSLSVMVTDAFRHVVTQAKTSGNYTEGLYLAQEAQKYGCTQILWLDTSQQFIEELSTMNIFFVYDRGRLVTPRLNGRIMPGILRDSILKLAFELGYEVREENMEIKKVLNDIASGKIKEVFGSGTAAGIAPIDRLVKQGKSYVVKNGQENSVCKHLRSELIGIQMGIAKDRFGWIHPVNC